MLLLKDLISKKLLAIVSVGFLLFGFFLAQVSTTAQSNTNTILNIQSESLVMGPFEINPSQILLGEDLIFSLTDIRLGTGGGFATGLMCKMFITAPDGISVVELNMQVDSEGNCRYDTSLDLVSQGVTLISGDISLLNNIVGIGSGYVTIDYLGEVVTSNTDVYEVVELDLINPEFEISPNRILLGENLVFSLSNAKYSNGDIAQGLECRHFLSAPDGSKIELSGTTNSLGECVYSINQGLVKGFGIIGIAQSMGLISGDVSKLNQVVGSGLGYGEVYLNGVAYRTNDDTYVVGEEEPEDIVRIITRTGGVYGGVILFVSAILIVGAVYVSLRAKKSS
ncbi:MAG: hypothetical protein HC932_02455 [Thermales bacterium]|nr:hypothetical protein [Thermales bacterium]